MYKIVYAKRLNANTVEMKIFAPAVAGNAEPGQFIMLRIDENGERIPLTIAGADKENGTIHIIFQELGKTTKCLGALKTGDVISDFAGPLGEPSPLEGLKKVAVIGGGLGIAIAYPQAKKLKSLGAEVHMIAGFRSKDVVILENEVKQLCDKTVIMTDDGSNGNKGLVTDALGKMIEEGNDYDAVIAIGPLIMMKFTALLTKRYGIKTLVSMAPVMVDGTGMCGGCRVTVDGKVKFACVDGPDFDGHSVDFDEAIRRQSYYKDKEKAAAENHLCRMEGNI